MGSGSPEASSGAFFTSGLRNMPRNMAMTAEPMRWMGSRLSSQQARAAMPTDSKMPGNSLTVFMGNLSFFDIAS